jgi:hypothetical protein
MPIFTSSREKYLWVLAFIVLLAIFSTLLIGQPLIKLLANQNLQAVLFVLGMILVGGAIILHMIELKPGKIESVIVLGIGAVYIMLFLRLGLPERSHLIEYSVLAIFIHKALDERSKNYLHKIPPFLLAYILTFLIGVMDEAIQLFLPNRIFDPLDILFNGIAATLAIGSNVIFSWIRMKSKKQPEHVNL